MVDNRQHLPATNRVYYFATCLIDLFFPTAGLAGMQLLRRAGVEVIFPSGQTCCGQPAFNSGYRGQARAVARAQLATLPHDLPVIVPSASCAGMLRHHWPELFAGDPDHAAACAVAARTYELTEYLLRVLHIDLEDIGPPTKVAIHTSCSARREMGVGDCLPGLLDQLGSVQFSEPARATECCGFGGTFAIKQPAISGAMLQDKTEALRACAADLILSQDCGCLMNIGGGLDKQGQGPPVMHIAEFLWRRTQPGELEQ